MNPKQSRFCEEYLVDLNATQAAIRAGYSEKTAYSAGHANLKKPEIAAFIAAGMAARSQRTTITQDKVLADLEAVKQNAMSKTTDKDGYIRMTNPTAALKACELQGRHLGMWNDRIAVTGEVSIAVAIRQRIAGRIAKAKSVPQNGEIGR
jgi:phage terminase small subunit